ncbi:MAG: group I intron-associated PD-(D/E)XK endonuclease [Terriglobales bacterium]|jgi:long-subunit fatty acid transport protein
MPRPSRQSVSHAVVPFSALAPKRRGEFSEAAFLAKAVNLGFKIVQPWGNSERYDLILGSGSRFWRVQIKSTSAKRSGGYHIQPSHFVYGNRKVVYTSGEIDVLAAHVVPLDTWYIVPASSLAPGMSLRLYPEGGCRSPRFEHFREAWDVFRSE